MRTKLFKESCSASDAGGSECAFSLLDLVVLLGTLALLCVLVPAYAGSSRKAGVLECKANLRQVGTAMDGFTKDHQDMLPGPLWSAMFYVYAGSNSPINSSKPTTYALAYHLAPYLGLPLPDRTVREAGQLKCPVSFRMKPAVQGNPNPLATWVAYRSSIAVTNTPGAPDPGYYTNRNDDIISLPFGRPDSPAVPTIKLSSIRRPSEQWALVDVDQANGIASSTYFTYLARGPVHSDYPSATGTNGAVRNYLYFDGSVRPVQTQY